MQLTYDIGEEVIKRLKSYLNVPINIMDQNGVIIASTDEKRIGQYHSGAKQVIEENKEMILSPEEIHRYPGTRPGVNLPLFHFDHLVGVVGITGNPADVISAAGIIKAAVEIAIEQIYMQKQQVYKERALQSFLQKLFHPIGIDEEELKKEAAYILECSLNQNMFVMVFHLSNAHEKVESMANTMYQSLHSPLFLTYITNREIVAAFHESVNHEYIFRLAVSLKKQYDDLYAGVGHPYASIKGLRKSYFQAIQALKFLKQQRSDHFLTFAEDWTIEQLIEGIPEELFQDVLERYVELFQNLDGEFLKTLTTYFDHNLHVNRSAQSLHIHRNTMLYRLEQINRKMGLNPKEFDDAVLLYILCKRLGLFGQMHNNH